MLIHLTTEKLQKFQNNEKSPGSVPSPTLTLVKLNTVDFSLVSFNEFMYRIDLHSQWVTENLGKISAKQMLKQLISKCKIQVTTEDIKTFGKELKKIFSPDFEFSFADYRALTFAWYQACHSAEDLRAKLIQTISDFEELKNRTLPEHEKSAVNDIVANLKVKLKEIPSYQIREENFENKCVEGIAQVFKFYSKQQFLIGKTPTFESIKVNTEVLNLSKFIQFCKDFRIIKEEVKDKAKSMTKFLRQVFIQTAEFSRNMSENHFLLALEKVSQRFFDSNFDKENNTRWSQLPVNDKKLKFYEYLNLHRPEIYSVRLKGLMPHFGVDQYDRIPDYDLAKKYRPKPEKMKLAKIKVDEWKKTKIKKKIEDEQEARTQVIAKKGYTSRYEKLKGFKKKERNKESEGVFGRGFNEESEDQVEEQEEFYSPRNYKDLNSKRFSKASLNGK